MRQTIVPMAMGLAFLGACEGTTGPSGVPLASNVEGLSSCVLTEKAPRNNQQVNQIDCEMGGQSKVVARVDALDEGAPTNTDRSFLVADKSPWRKRYKKAYDCEDDVTTMEFLSTLHGPGRACQLKKPKGEPAFVAAVRVCDRVYLIEGMTRARPLVEQVLRGKITEAFSNLACRPAARVLGEAPAGGIAGIGEADARGSIRLDSAYLDQERYQCHNGMTAAGSRDVCVLIKRYRSASETGSYSAGVYLNKTGSGGDKVKALMYLPAEQPLVVTYHDEGKHLRVLCPAFKGASGGGSCDVQRYYSNAPSAQFPGAYANLHVLGNATKLVAVRPSADRGCDIAVAGRDSMGKGATPANYDYWEKVDTRLMLKDGESSRLKGIGQVRCQWLEQEGAVSANIDFLQSVARAKQQTGISLPPDVAIRAPTNIPAEQASYSGAWLGRWPWGATHALVVTDLSEADASVIYAVSKSRFNRQIAVPADAVFEGDALVVTFSHLNTTVTYRTQADGNLKALHVSPRGSRETVLQRVELDSLL